MRTPKALYPQAREVYICELENCPICGGRLVTCDYRSGRKTVQTLTSVKAVAYQARRCAAVECEGRGMRWGSARWQQLAPQYCTYGYDVIAQIGWQRQTYRQRFEEVHTGLRDMGVQISETHVRTLYHESYLPLLACDERKRWDELLEVSKTSGLIVSLDGLAPEGGEAQLWIIRELQTGMTLRSGWLSKQDQDTFEAFLQPIVEAELEVIAVLSDKEAGLLPAVALVFPQAKHGLCQMHYLKNAADPLAAADEAMKRRLRAAVREEVGELIRDEGGESPGVLTVTGLIPTPSAHEGPAPPLASIEGEREAVVTDLMRRVRYLLTLKGRPPLRLAGVETADRLREVMDYLEAFIAHVPEPRLLHLRQGLHKALASIAEDYDTLHQASDWLHQIADLLDPDGKPPRTGDAVKSEFFTLLDDLRQQSQDDPVLAPFALHIDKVSRRYAPGLFHTYDLPALPRTNNDRESEFRDLKRRLLSSTGQKGATRRILQRSGAWELIPRPSSFAATFAALSGVNLDAFQRERQRLRTHRARFKLHTRSTRLAQKQLAQLLERWRRLPSRASPV
jgi:hypothetical protein